MTDFEQQLAEQIPANRRRIAFCGYARTGKDEASRALVVRGYERGAFGDIIKQQISPIVRRYLGFSAFTENDVQKKRIRAVLESWGDANYDNILAEYFKRLPMFAVNSRLVRPREGRMWREHGGVLVLLRRPFAGAATPWEKAALSELEADCGWDHVIDNNGTVEALWQKVYSYVGLLP
jgi:hypothetical protein